MGIEHRSFKVDDFYLTGELSPQQGMEKWTFVPIKQLSPFHTKSQ